MSEYMKVTDDNGDSFLVEVAPVSSESVEYFWMISVEFSKALSEPVVEYVPGGQMIRSHDTGSGFVADVYRAQPGEKVTRMSLLRYAIRRAVEQQNTSRRAAGKTTMFDETHAVVQGFDCGRNAL